MRKGNEGGEGRMVAPLAQWALGASPGGPGEFPRLAPVRFRLAWGGAGVEPTSLLLLGGESLQHLEKK